MSNQLSQLPVEVLIQPSTPVDLQVSQLPVEALRTFDVATVALQMSQLPIEVLHSAEAEVPPASAARVEWIVCFS